MFDHRKFSLAVADLRQVERLSLREMAHSIGISAATLSRIENEHKPDIDSFVKICVWAEWWDGLIEFKKIT